MKITFWISNKVIFFELDNALKIWLRSRVTEYFKNMMIFKDVK